MISETFGFLLGVWMLWLGFTVFLLMDYSEDHTPRSIFGITFIASGITIIRIVKDWYNVRQEMKRAKVNR